MKKLVLKFVVCLLAVSVSLVRARAGSVTNDFTAQFNYVASGILGDTNWDGVYLRFGDVPGGNDSGDGAGNSTVADSGVTVPGYLSVNSTSSSWAGAGDDGFFLYKVVAGDFDASVQVAQFFPNPNYHFAGLLVRAYNPDNSGAPYSATVTNAVENYLTCTRFQEFGVGEHVKSGTNGVDLDGVFTTPSDPTDTNTTRYVRITRAGDLFSFYDRTNQTDAWNLMGSLNRPDLHGVKLQVGIQDAYFTGDSGLTDFTDFELSGTNVTKPPTMSAAPSNLITSSPNPNGSLTLSWKTNGGTGSIVIVRKLPSSSGVFSVNPVQGFTYLADTNFQSTNHTLIAGNTRVVYAGAATNVTVTGLGGSNNVYIAEVLSYDNSGASVVYNTGSPATIGFLGSGVPSSVSIAVFPTNMPVGGAGLVQVIATFTTGDQVDVTKDPSTTLNSSDPSVILINNGILNGLQIGTSTISASYAGFSGGSQVNVITPRFADNFSVSHDYIISGLPGSTWDGLYLRLGDIPGGDDGGDAMFTTIANANVSSNNILSISAGGTTWEGTSDDGFYMFKIMPGDFQAVVHVDLSAHGAYQFAGLLARAANADGGPYLGSENYVANWFFDQFGVTTSARETVNGVYQGPNDQFGGTPINTMWLLLQRVNGTNFYCYSKQNPGDSWTLNTTLIQPTLTTGVPVQIGLAQSTYQSTPSELVRFDSFALDGTGLIAVPPIAVPLPATNFTMTLNPDVTMTLRWYDPTANDGTAPAVSRSLVIMRAGAPVSAQPFLANGIGGDQQSPNTVFGQASDNLGSGNYVVYRTTAGDTNNHQQVTVSGLSPGVIYYAAVYTFNGLGASRTFNTVITASTNLVDGVLIGLQSSLPGNGIPLGGVGLPQINGVFTGGGLANIASSAHIVSGNTSVMVTTNGVLTGIALGSTTAIIDYSGFTNQLTVTVRNPSFTDNFGISHDYLANGVTGTPWDGVYLSGTNLPDKTFLSSGLTAALAADANISSNNVLSVTNINSGYEFDQDDGFFLFKYVPADFQVAVNLLTFTNSDVAGFNQPFNNSGVMARGYTIATNGTLGAPMDQSGNECWVDWVRFDEFGIGTRYELTIDNGTTRPTNPDSGGPDRYMLMARVNGTNFFFFQRTLPTDPWHATGVGARTGTSAVAKFAGQPMQVGLVVGGFNSGTPVNVGFSNFMLDIGSPGLSITASGTNVIVSWPGSPSAQLQSTPTLSPPNWQPVIGTPVFANGQYRLTLPATNNRFFRLKD